MLRTRIFPRLHPLNGSSVPLRRWVQNKSVAGAERVCSIGSKNVFQRSQIENPDVQTREITKRPDLSVVLAANLLSFPDTSTVLELVFCAAICGTLFRYLKHRDSLPTESTKSDQFESMQFDGAVDAVTKELYAFKQPLPTLANQSNQLALASNELSKISSFLKVSSESYIHDFAHRTKLGEVYKLAETASESCDTESENLNELVADAKQAGIDLTRRWRTIAEFVRVGNYEEIEYEYNQMNNLCENQIAAFEEAIKRMKTMKVTSKSMHNEAADVQKRVGEKRKKDAEVKENAAQRALEEIAEYEKSSWVYQWWYSSYNAKNYNRLSDIRSWQVEYENCLANLGSALTVHNKIIECFQEADQALKSFKAALRSLRNLVNDNRLRSEPDRERMYRAMTESNRIDK